ncbi:MAG: hypothetical protein BWZ07_03171 [Alphaproteobacteria bacterium ADurb.BinA280]|nr:MAG: hypothetical protein BWZ07_03171 [Alphaproteobacteria bacterium ADurb.BinA280]
MLHVRLVLYQIDPLGRLPHGAFDLGVTFMADHDDFHAVAPQLGDLNVHFGDQRTGGVKHTKFALGGFGL